MGLYTFASATPLAEGQAAPNTGATMLPLIILAVLFIGFMMFSNKRRRKKQAEQMAALRDGDRVQLTGGMHGTIISMGAREAFVEIAPGVVVTFVPQAIVGKLPEPVASDAADDEDLIIPQELRDPAVQSPSDSDEPGTDPESR